MGASVLCDVRSRAALLLRAAMGDLALDRSRAACGFWQTGALAFPNTAELVYEPAARKRLSVVGSLSLMDRRRAAVVSIVQMVRGRELAATRLVAVVSLIRGGEKECE